MSGELRAGRALSYTSGEKVEIGISEMIGMLFSVWEIHDKVFFLAFLLQR